VTISASYTTPGDTIDSDGSYDLKSAGFSGQISVNKQG
jgi:hypothetical protein